MLATRHSAARRLWVTNGCADNMCGTSEVPQLADPLCATRKSAEVGQIADSCAATLFEVLVGDHEQRWGSFSRSPRSLLFA